jgi:hypothetical protein
MALTPNQLAALPTNQRIFGQQDVAGYNGELYTAFICYGCLEDKLYTVDGSYPHFLSMETKPKNKIPTGEL